MLASDIKVAGMVFARGMVIGKEEVVKLNNAGVQNVDVIRVGIADLLADAAIDHLNRRLAGPSLMHLPSRNGQGQIIASCVGMIDYDEMSLDKFRADHPDFHIETIAPRSMVCARQNCLTTKLIELVVPRESLIPCLNDAPVMCIDSQQQLKAAVYCNGNGFSKPVKETSKILEEHGSKVVLVDKKIADYAKLTVGLARSTASDVAILLMDSKDNLEIVRSALGESHSHSAMDITADKGKTLAIGMIGSTTVVATMVDKGFNERARNILSRLHGNFLSTGKPKGTIN